MARPARGDQGRHLGDGQGFEGELNRVPACRINGPALSETSQVRGCAGHGMPDFPAETLAGGDD